MGDEDEEKRAEEMKQRNMGRGHEDGHREEMVINKNRREHSLTLLSFTVTNCREVDIIHKNVNIRGNLLV